MRKNLDALSDVDAGWFLRAVREGHVVEEGEFFSSGLAGAKEKILWSDAGVGGARRAHLWLEPVITIGALARLAEEYRWPRDRVGLQSKAPWPFDLMGYGADRETEVLACEVKKAPREIDVLVRDMTRFAAIPPLPQDPDSSTPRNAYRKVVGIRRTWPDLFWALGPAGYGKLFEIARAEREQVFSLIPASPDRLRFSVRRA